MSISVRSGLAAIAVVALALGACSSDDDSDDGATDTTATTTEITTDNSEAEADGGDTDGGDVVTTAELTLATEAPDGATIVVASGAATEDRVVRRGSQSEIEQGQTFAVDTDSALSVVAFEVLSPATVPAGQVVEAALYEVDDTVTMVPSRPIALDATDDGRLVLPLPDELAADTPTHLVFSFPAVDVAAGQYAVALSIGDGVPATELYVQHAEGDALPDGMPIRHTGPGWVADTVNGDSAIALVLTV